MVGILDAVGLGSDGKSAAQWTIDLVVSGLVDLTGWSATTVKWALGGIVATIARWVFVDTVKLIGPPSNRR